MTSTATVKFRDCMAYEKFSDAITIFEKACTVLLLKINFDRWVYFADKTLKGQGESVEEDDMNNDEDNSSRDQSGISFSDDSDKTVENILHVSLYQQKIKKRKDKREMLGKWTPEGMKRLISLITTVQVGRNYESREHFEEELQDMYIKQVDRNTKLMAKNKRKREIEEMNSMKKGIVVTNVLDLVAL